VKAAEAREALEHELSERGVDPASPNPPLVWEAFQRFGARPVDDVPNDPALDADGLLVEFGTYDWHDGEGERFQLSFVRQFTFYDEDDYDHMEHVRCVLSYPPDSQVGEGSMWSFGLTPDEFVRNVEALEGFRAALNRTPTDLSVRHEEV
jgi:hypothetical protein